MKHTIVAIHRTWGCIITALACALFTSLPARAGGIFDSSDSQPHIHTKPTSNPAPAPNVHAPASAPSKPATPAAAAPSPDAAASPPLTVRPIPSEAERQRSQHLLEEIFATDLAAAGPAARRALAQKLLSEAALDKGNASDEFVLLEGARHAAEQGDDLKIAFQAIDALARNFDLDALVLKSRSIDATSIKADTATQTLQNCSTAMEFLNDLIAAGYLTNASRLLSQLTAPAESDAAMRDAVKRAAKRLDLLNIVQDRIARDIEKLKTAPNDAAANLAVGQYTCFYLKQWDRGLPMLSLGSDSHLKSLAADEIAQSGDTKNLADLADRWWTIADKQSETAKPAIREHAASLYERALGSETGLRREVMIKRIAEAAPSGDGRIVNLLTLINPDKNTVEGTWTIAANTLEGSAGQKVARLAIPYVPPEEYDLRMEFVRTGDNSEINVILVKGQRQFGLMLAGWGNTICGFEMIDGKRADNNTSTRRAANWIQSGHRYNLLVKVRGDHIEAYLDGALLTGLKTDYGNLSATTRFAPGRPDVLGLYIWQGDIKISIAEVVEITGRGKAPH